MSFAYASCVVSSLFYPPNDNFLLAKRHNNASNKVKCGHVILPYLFILHNQVGTILFLKGRNISLKMITFKVQSLNNECCE